LQQINFARAKTVWQPCIPVSGEKGQQDLPIGTWRIDLPTELENEMARNFFRSALDAMIEARAKQASRYVNGALLMLDDETLAANGYKREELRRNASVSYHV
jgi:hypothetical protein